MRHYNMYDYYDYGSSFSSTLDRIAWGLVMIVTIFLIVWAIFSLGSYILRGIGMYTIAKRLGVDYAWLAFVPLARTYLHGELSGSILLKKKSIQNPGVWLLALPFLYGAVYSILYGILWFVGFGTFMKMDSYNYIPYNISTGNIMGIVVVFLILMVVSIAYAAFYKAFEVLVNHQILERFTSKNMSIVHGILCSIIPMYESICFFVMRNRPFNPGMEPPTPTPFMQSPPPDPYYNHYGQTGYTNPSMQDGYSNYSGTSGSPEPNSYGNFGGSSGASEPNSYGNFGGSSGAPESNSYGNFGGSSGAPEPNNYGNFSGQPAQTQNESPYNSAPVNFVLSGNEGTEEQRPTDTNSVLKPDSSEGKSESEEKPESD